MKRMTHAIIAMGAALLFGCAGADDAQLFNPETGEACDQPGEPERPYMQDAEYNADGCTRTERMAKVRAFRDMKDPFDASPPVGPMPGETNGEYGTARQPINIPFGLGFGVTVDGFGNFTGTTGRCNPSSSWTTALPLRGNCVIPKGMNRIHWEVWPGYDSNVQYMRARAKNAFAAWSRSVTYCNQTFTPQLQTAANSEQPLLTNEEDRYATAAVSIYPAIDSEVTMGFMGHAEVDDALAQALTPARNGIRYWAWSYMPIAVNHTVIEGIKADACIGPNDPNRDLRIQRAYEWVLAHEFGHTFGLPHFNSGLMRPGNFQSCEEIYSTQSITSRSAAMTAEERALVADTRDSSGLSVHNTGTASCGTPLQQLPATSFDDILAL